METDRGNAEFEGELSVAKQWTALIESIVLGDGGQRHIATLKPLSTQVPTSTFQIVPAKLCSRSPRNAVSARWQKFLRAPLRTKVSPVKLNATTPQTQKHPW
jgi:hypothetical protein